MAIGSILRGLGSKISGSALGRGAAGLGQRVASSPLGVGAANLGSAGANYAKLGYGKTINQIVRQFGVDEETAKRILMGLGGAGALGTGYAMSGDEPKDNPFSSYYNYPKAWGEAPAEERWHSDPSSTGGMPPWIKDRFGFGVDARQLTDEQANITSYDSPEQSHVRY